MKLSGSRNSNLERVQDWSLRRLAGANPNNLVRFMLCLSDARGWPSELTERPVLQSCRVALKP